MKKINDEIASALAHCAENLTISELSRRTGIRIDILGRYISKQTQAVREETWNRIYPVLKPYLPSEDNDAKPETPVRIGKPYRRHNELVAMTSDQKVLLDVFEALPEARKKAVLTNWQNRTNTPAPCVFESLSADENKLMAAFLAFDESTREAELLAIIPEATGEIRRRRKQLF